MQTPTFVLPHFMPAPPSSLPVLPVATVAPQALALATWAWSCWVAALPLCCPGFVFHLCLVLSSGLLLVCEIGGPCARPDPPAGIKECEHTITDFVASQGISKRVWWLGNGSPPRESGMALQ